MTFAAVIPALDEAAALPATLDALRAAARGHAVETVVVDGGSRDATRAVAAERGARVVSATGGRGAQVHAGVAATASDAVLVLHADTWLPAGAFDAMRRALEDPAVSGGAFRKAFRDGPAALRRGARWRSAALFHATGILMGDQAMFARRESLERSGGVPRQPLMEDVELSRRLARAGRVVLLDAAVSTSGRRFERRGVARTWALMAALLAGHWMGVPPARLARWYRGKG